MSQKKRSAATFEDTLIELLDFYLPRQDPVEKAKRNLNAKADAPRQIVQTTAALNNAPASVPDRSKTANLQKRTALDAQLKHQVFLRDQGQCTHKNQLGEPCENKLWIEIHHQIPISKGGTNRIENLATLCHSHHRTMH